jgi:uncharacterized repeat protein (TIGR03803 family)
MKVRLRKCCGLLAMALVVLDSIWGNGAKAQTFTTLHSFTNSSDGGVPFAGLVLVNGALYGTTSQGGDFGGGTIFSIKPDGTSFTPLHSFQSNAEGAHPLGHLVSLGGVLYGAASQGGPYGSGTLFKINPDGTGFNVLYSFTALDTSTSTNSDGAGLLEAIVAGNGLFGTTARGGPLGGGTVFALNTDGTGFTRLQAFARGTVGHQQRSGVIWSGGFLYGTTEFDGVYGDGSVFALGLNGTGFTDLFSFSTMTQSSNIDGGFPIASLASSGNTLYGTTIIGGMSAWGTVFRINADGTAFTNLHNFAAFSENNLTDTNSDGTGTAAPLLVSGSTLFGTASLGGSSGNGTIFALNTDGTGFNTLHHFSATSGTSGFFGTGTNLDGANPQSNLVLSGGILYGTASAGGSTGYGTIFRISLGRPLAIASSGNNFILAWTTNATGLVLQSTTTLNSSAWSTNYPAPVVTNGQYTVTIPVSGTQRFFRLSQ